jgi:hypothetical protein
VAKSGQEHLNIQYQIQEESNFGRRERRKGVPMKSEKNVTPQIGSPLAITKLQAITSTKVFSTNILAKMSMNMNQPKPIATAASPSAGLLTQVGMAGTAAVITVSFIHPIDVVKVCRGPYSFVIDIKSDQPERELTSSTLHTFNTNGFLVLHQ